jgi:hypothetical protein
MVELLGIVEESLTNISMVPGMEVELAASAFSGELYDMIFDPIARFEASTDGNWKTH